METLDNTEELASQKDALKIYLDSLLKSSETPSIVESEESVAQVTPSEKIYNSVLAEINHTDEHIRTPSWATEYFSCLPVTVAGITLFLPLRHVRTVMPFSQKVDLVKDAPEWIMGGVNTSAKHLKIIDLQKIAYQKMETPEQTEPALQLVLIGDGKWGFTCDAVGKVHQLNRDEVQWRAKSAERRWVAGVSNTHRLAIIDIKRIEFAMALESHLV